MIARAVTSANITVVRIVDTQIRRSPSASICTIDKTDARMDTIPKIVIRFMIGHIPGAGTG